MSARTDFRNALQVALAAALSLEFHGGKIEGPQPDRSIGCVWWEGKRPFARDGNQEENFFRVRVFKLFKQDQGAETPRVDQEDALELVAEQLEDALASVLVRTQLEAAATVTLDSRLDFFTVMEITPNHEAQYVEALIHLQARNRTARGG